MPLYEYKCPTCDTRFELRRSMSEASDAATCPDGHPAVKLLSVFASVGASSGSSSAPAPMPTGGGGCGGHCACH